MEFLFALIMGVVGGPAMALAMRSANMRKGFEQRQEKFRAGRGKDPAKDAVGPHRSFLRNMLILGVLMFAFGGAIAFGAGLVTR